MDYAKPAVKVFVSQVLSAPSFKDGRIYHKLGNFVFQRVWLQVGAVVPQCPCRSGVRCDFFGLSQSVIFTTSVCGRVFWCKEQWSQSSFWMMGAEL